MPNRCRGEAVESRGREEVGRPREKREKKLLWKLEERRAKPKISPHPKRHKNAHAEKIGEVRYDNDKHGVTYKNQTERLFCCGEGDRRRKRERGSNNRTRSRFPVPKKVVVWGKPKNGNAGQD